MPHPNEAKITHRVFSKFPVLEIDHEFGLRDFKVSDARYFYRYMNDPRMRPFFHPTNIPKSLSQAIRDLEFRQSFYKKQLSIHWVIVKKDTDEMIGECGFEYWFRFHNRLELAYHMHPEYWGQGIATKALATIFRYAYEQMEVNRIEGFTILDNPASHRVLEKLGFAHEGVLKQYRFYQGRYQDINIYAHTRDHYLDEQGFVKRILAKLKKV
jgi:ribosomal-protein-alanine N-acetyltransferase